MSEFGKGKFPIYDITVNDEDESVDFVALTDNPAIERSFMFFDKQKQSVKFVSNSESRTIFGPLILADTPIERVKGDNVFYVRFPKETVRKIAQKFFKQNNQKNVNAYHQSEIDGLCMYESFITNFERGVNNPKGYEDVPEGSWYGGYYVENEDVWQNFIKTGIFTGFSVEGLFGLNFAPDEQKQEMSKQQRVGDVVKMIIEINNILHHLEKRGI